MAVALESRLCLRAAPGQRAQVTVEDMPGDWGESRMPL